MMQSDVRWMLTVALSCAGLCGCGGGSSSVTTNPPTKTAPPVVEDSGKSAPAIEKVAPPAAPDSPPVAAVRAVLRDVDAGHLEALADFLPDSYQHELEKLIGTLIEKTPDDSWNRVRSVVSKAAQLLKKQPGFAADLAEDDRERLAAALDQLSDPAAWDRSQRDKWNLRRFLAGPGSTLLSAWQQGQSANSALLAGTEIRLVSLDGDRATLELRSPVDTEFHPVEFVQTDGKWIPKSIAETWTATIQQAIGRLAEVGEDDVAAAAGRIGSLLLQVEGTLDQMLKAERPEEVQLGWWQIQSLLIQGRQELLEPGPQPRVELRVTGELSEDELSQLLDQLLALTDHPDAAEYVTFPTTTGLVIQLSPVEDVDEFAGRLKFATVKSHDAEARVVELELKK